MRKKTVLVTLAAMLCVLLSGCLPWSAENAYKLPQPPKNYENLMQVVAQSKRELAQAHSTTVEDVPPSAGDNTSTVQLLDMDDDGIQETAVTFFRVVGAEQPIRLYFYRLLENDSYLVSNVLQGEGSGVYAVHYADMDGAIDPITGKTTKEVVVSWQMGSDANYLGVYGLGASQAQALTLLMTTYESYRLADLDRDGLMELAVGRIDPELGGEVEVHNWDISGTDKMERVVLSKGISSITAMRANYLTDFVPALYVSGQLSDGSRVTDVVALRGGLLTNLSLDPETGVSREKVSLYRELAASDVNSDYILEVARPYEIELSLGATKPWLVDWVQYTSGGRARNICTTYHNSADGWYLVIPEHWRDKLVVYRNDSVSGQRAVIFARWQGEDKEPLPFLSIYKLTGASRSLRATSGNRFILAEDSSTIYAATFYNTWDCGLDQSSLLENFRLMVRDWSGD